MRSLVTGGCGFIGSALVRQLIRSGHTVWNIDKLTYAGDERTVAEASSSSAYHFQQADITDTRAVAFAFETFRPDTVFHLAAESHVDRSIDSPIEFIETNVRGTFNMLECALNYWKQIDAQGKAQFRFIHISTDEVFGSLGREGYFTEITPYAPSSPYSATKAGADHLVRAWVRTYGLPANISNCSNNYGPFQNREKLVPTVIRKALNGQPIPIYGRGENVRDWLFVDDHVAALLAIRDRGVSGESYNIGGNNEVSNLDIAQLICSELDRSRPRADGKPHASAISFVTDRPGHDFRYAIDPSKAREKLGWTPRHDLSSGIASTVAWYLEHPEWIAEARQDDRVGLSNRSSTN